MDRGYLHGENLIGYEEMAHIGLGVGCVDIARTVFLQRREIIGPLAVAHVHDAVAGEEHAVATVAGRHHAVHHINAAVNRLKYIGRSAYAHQITRTVCGQNVIDHLDHLIHHLGRLAYGKTADGISVGSEIGHDSRRRSGYVTPCTIGK